jgi:aldehyde dehydrogenase (NAD+)
VGDSGFGRIHGDQGIREFTRAKATAEQVMKSPINLMSFKLPRSTGERVTGMIRQLYGSGSVARAKDALRRLL